MRGWNLSLLFSGSHLRYISSTTHLLVHFIPVHYYCSRLRNDTNSLSAHPITPSLGDFCPASITVTGVVHLVGFSEGSFLYTSHICYSNPAAVARLDSAACGLFIAYSSRVCLWPAVRAAGPLWWKTLGPSHPFHICSNQLFNRTAN